MQRLPLEGKLSPKATDEVPSRGSISVTKHLISGAARLLFYRSHAAKDT